MKSGIFLWRENYLDYLWATETTGKHYFFDSGYLIYHGGVLSAYATNREIKKALILTNNLIKNPEALLETKKDFSVIKKKINIFHKTFVSLNIKELSNDGIFSLYNDLIKLYGEYIEIYRFTEPHLLKHVENNIKKIVSKRVNSRKSTDVLLAEILSSKKTKIKEYGLQKYEDDFDLVNSISKIRFEAKKIIENLLEDTEILLKETAVRTNYAVSQISNMSLDELRKLLSMNVKIDTHKLNARSKIFGIKVLVKNGKTFLENLSLKQINAIEKNENTKKKEIGGTVAYPGKIKGRAKIASLLFSKSDYEKFFSSLKKGDIIIAPMTSPDLTIGFSKVSGIITDEGGLMSHAALVSREYKIPCLVGTKTATKFFKDGERILLDARNGIAKKIS